MTVDLDAVEQRYMAALDAKPSKGPVTRWDALTDCVADVGDLVDELRELRELVAARVVGLVNTRPMSLENLAALGLAVRLPLCPGGWTESEEHKKVCPVHR